MGFEHTYAHIHINCHLKFFFNSFNDVHLFIITSSTTELRVRREKLSKKDDDYREIKQ